VSRVLARSPVGGARRGRGGDSLISRMPSTNPTTEEPRRVSAPLGSRPARRFRRAVSFILAVSVIAASVSLVLRYGFAPPLVSDHVLVAIELAAIAAFILDRVSRLWPPSGTLTQLRRYWLDYSLIVIGAGLVALDVEAYHPVRQAGIVYLIMLGAVIVIRYGLALYRVQIGMVKRGPQPGTLVVLSFAAVILLGGFLLTLPTVSRPILAGEHPYQWREHVINCLFTATSATCVTGLTVYRTGHDFTLAGQVIILILIQIGGLGIMVMGTVFAMLAGRQIGLRESLVIRDVLSESAAGEIGRTVKFVCMSTFAIEAVGAVILYPMWTEADAANGGRWFWSIFHAVSAFCNAGLSLQDDNLIPYRKCWQVYGMIMPLIVVGGVGFPVLRELYLHATGRLWLALRRLVARVRGRVPPRPHRRHYSLHAKLTLTTTAVLILGSTVLFWIMETPAKWTRRYEVRMDRQVLVQNVPDRMSSMPAGERFWAALFLSVTPRTAGFNTVLMDEQSLSLATHYLLCLLMFIGGSPASTAGGIKTVTFAVLIAAIAAVLRGRDRVEGFRRTISDAVVGRAFVVTALMFGMVFVVTWLLCYFESHSLLQLLFETISASGTVGLSTGITPNLTKIGRILIILCMFAGRVGPLTVLMALAGRARRAHYEYPEEQPIIG
jgi:trk system potassium uptake protein TrkH